MQADQVHHVGRDPMGQCNHEEADTRVLVDLLHALQTSSLGLVHTGGTDVIVILLSHTDHIKAVNAAAEILISFNAGRCSFSCHLAVDQWESDGILVVTESSQWNPFSG